MRGSLATQKRVSHRLMGRGDRGLVHAPWKRTRKYTPCSCECGRKDFQNVFNKSVDPRIRIRRKASSSPLGLRVPEANVVPRDCELAHLLSCLVFGPVCKPGRGCSQPLPALLPSAVGVQICFGSNFKTRRARTTSQAFQRALVGAARRRNCRFGKAGNQQPTERCFIFRSRPVWIKRLWT